MSLNKILISFLAIPFNITLATTVVYFDYKIEKGDSFTKIIKKFIISGKEVRSTDAGVSQTIKKNDHIKNWEKLFYGEKIVLFITKSKANISQIKLYKKNNAPKIILKKKKKLQDKVKLLSTKPIGLKRKKQKKVSMNAFFTTSKGKFEELFINNNQVIYNQTSPITLGFFLKFNDDFHKIIFDSSIYLSYISKVSISGFTNYELSTPPEIGLTTHGNYKFSNKRWSIFAGIDFERFTTFNLDQILIDNRSPDTISHPAFFTNTGISYTLPLFNGTFTTKLSYGIILKDLADTPYEFTGSKYLVYFMYSPNNHRFLYHILIKRHDLDGDSQLTTTRYGIGLGYKFN